MRVCVFGFSLVGPVVVSSRDPPPTSLSPQRNSLDWAFESAPQESLNGRVVFLPRGKVLGGSSSLNAMLWVRGHQENYDGWARAGGLRLYVPPPLVLSLRTESHPAFALAAAGCV